MLHFTRTRRFLATWTLALVATVVALSGTSRALDAAPPKPSPFPVQWELEFEPGPMRLYVDPLNGDGYWYFTYQITNQTGQDRVWAPDLVLYSDAGEILESGRDVPNRVREAARQMLGNDLLELPSEIIGDLLRGRENAREGLAIWPADDLSVNELTLFIGGISGETARVRHPRTGQEFILRKTMVREYLIRGEALAYGDDPFELTIPPFWVMR
ncbi:MAG: hypothetical protein AB8G96_12950 [Phycisphaerales bacterium]